MSALKRNPQVPALTPHKVLGPSIDGRGIPRGRPSNSHGDWPFLTPPPRVPEVPVVSQDHLPHSRRGLTPLGRRQKYPRIHVSTEEESSGSGTDSTQGLRPRHRRERNPERPPRNSHGELHFLRPPHRVPEVPVVSREHLPQLEKIQEVLPSRRDEAHFR